jgi:sporulation protein YlmC with PRC-barrel domain
MLKLVLLILLAVGQSWPLASSAQALTQEEIVRELIGAPVYSTDGHEVGTVADIVLDEDKLFDALLMKTSRSLGFGERTVRVPGGAFIALRGSVVLDVLMILHPSDQTKVVQKVNRKQTRKGPVFISLTALRRSTTNPR